MDGSLFFYHYVPMTTEDPSGYGWGVDPKYVSNQGLIIGEAAELVDGVPTLPGKSGVVNGDGEPTIINGFVTGLNNDDVASGSTSSGQECVWINRDWTHPVIFKTQFTPGLEGSINKDLEITSQQSLLRNYKLYDLKDLAPALVEYPNFSTVNINDSGLILANGIKNSDGEWHVLLLVPVALAVDTNRDGTIDFDSDVTSRARPYRFWINDDQDYLGYRIDPGTEVLDEQIFEGEIVPPSKADSTAHKINCLRNLEDFSRLWLYIGGMQEAIAAGTVQVGVKWKGVTGTPAINIYASADSSGSASYLSEDDAAQAQIAGNFNDAIKDKNNKLTVDTSGTFILPLSFWTGLSSTNPKKYLLFEGAGEGKGQLEFVFLDQNGSQVGEGGSLWLDLMNVKKMYVRARGTPSDGIPTPYSSSNPAITNQFTKYEPDTIDPSLGAQEFRLPWNEQKDAIILVHGIHPPFIAAARAYSENINVAETVFKRLWWRGYKGRFAFYKWPALNPAGIGNTGFNFNESEYRGWKYGSGLALFVQNGLPSDYTKNLFAHSQGNTVCGAALTVYGLQVDNYALTQAAVPAGCYDSSAGVNGYSIFATAETTKPTPDVTNNLGYRGCLSSLNVTGKVVNFENYKDFALATGHPANWETNQINSKPDHPSNLEFYVFTPTAPPGQQCWLSFLTGGIRFVTDPQESMAFLARPRSKAVGAEGNGYPLTGGSISNNGNVDLSADPYNFSDTIDDHGAQWNRNFQATWKYYQKLLEAFSQEQ